MRGRPYRRLRAQILADNVVTNHGLCTLKIKDVCVGVADCVHHILGITVTGHNRAYMAAACTPCNQRVGDPLHHVDPPHVAVTVW